MGLDDDVGIPVEVALAAAGARGVAVRVLVDSLHSLHGSFGARNSLFERLAERPVSSSASCGPSRSCHRWAISSAATIANSWSSTVRSRSSGEETFRTSTIRASRRYSSPPLRSGGRCRARRGSARRRAGRRRLRVFVSRNVGRSGRIALRHRCAAGGWGSHRSCDRTPRTSRGTHARHLPRAHQGGEVADLDHHRIPAAARGSARASSRASTGCSRSRAHRSCHSDV